MRTIAHISDLHFGRLNCATLPALKSAILEAKPDLIAVSGDLTQRARAGEFAAARAFLDTLTKPQIVVPGNHDIPLYDVFSRWMTPLKNYRRYINQDVEPFFVDQEIAVLGINTARSLTFKNGRINAKQVGQSCSRFRGLQEQCTRVLVTHHPFDVTDAHRESDVVGRADMAMAEFARCRVDMILTGHLHLSRASTSAVRYKGGGYSALFVQAGTATSLRQRGEVNTWNLIQIETDAICVQCSNWDLDAQAFKVMEVSRYTRTSEGWSDAGPCNAA